MSKLIPPPPSPLTEWRKPEPPGTFNTVNQYPLRIPPALRHYRVGDVRRWKRDVIEVGGYGDCRRVELLWAEPVDEQMVIVTHRFRPEVEWLDRRGYVLLYADHEDFDFSEYRSQVVAWAIATAELAVTELRRVASARRQHRKVSRAEKDAEAEAWLRRQLAGLGASRDEP